MSNVMVIDAENAVFGRLASYVAKQVLLGKEIAVVNSEKIRIIGNEKDITKKYIAMRRKGGSAMRGPYYPSIPYQIIKRAINGMLPKRKGRGVDALERVKCYDGIPHQFKDVKMTKSSRDIIPIKSMTLQELSQKLKHRHETHSLSNLKK